MNTPALDELLAQVRLPCVHRFESTGDREYPWRCEKCGQIREPLTTYDNAEPLHTI